MASHLFVRLIYFKTQVWFSNFLLNNYQQSKELNKFIFEKYSMKLFNIDYYLHLQYSLLICRYINTEHELIKISPSTSVDTANSASSCTPPILPSTLLSICRSAVMMASEICGASSQFTLRSTDCRVAHSRDWRSLYCTRSDVDWMWPWYSKRYYYTSNRY